MSINKDQSMEYLRQLAHCSYEQAKELKDKYHITIAPEGITTLNITLSNIKNLPYAHMMVKAQDDGTFIASIKQPNITRTNTNIHKMAGQHDLNDTVENIKDLIYIGRIEIAPEQKQQRLIRTFKRAVFGIAVIAASSTGYYFYDKDTNKVEDQVQERHQRL